MKMTSWGYSVLVFDSDKKPSACLVYADLNVPGGCGSRIEVGRLWSFDEVLRALQSRGTSL